MIERQNSPAWWVRTLNVNEVQARVALVLRDAPPDGRIKGELVGPRCEYARTVQTPSRWRPLPGGELGGAAFVADVIDACLWEPIHPYLYEGVWSGAESGQTTEVRVGLRQLLLTKAGLRLNGQPFRFRGLQTQPRDEAQLRRLHDWGCNLLDARDRTDTDLTDRFGPFVTARLPDDQDAAAAAVAAHGTRTPSIGIWVSGRTRSADEYRRLRALDPTLLFAETTVMDQLPDATDADLLLVAGPEARLLTVADAIHVPWVAAVRAPVAVDTLDAAGWDALEERLETCFTDERCLGWVVGPAGSEPSHGIP